MGQVFKAWHPELETFVAIKVLARNMSWDPRAVKDFRREGRTLGQMHDENVARAMDFGTTEGMPYLVMEYVHGINLEQLLQLPAPPDLNVLLLILRDIARGLEHAHERGIVHRDLKPANVMVDRGGIARLMDLGLGRRLRIVEQSTTTPRLAGTFGFMSPEQTQMQNPDLPSDIFSLGVVAYYVLTSEKPFADPSVGLEEHLRRVRQDEPTRIEVLRPELSPLLSQLIREMLRKEPAARPTIRHVLAEFEQELHRRGLSNGRELVQQYVTAIVPEDTDKPPSTLADGPATLLGRIPAILERVRKIGRVLLPPVRHVRAIGSLLPSLFLFVRYRDAFVIPFLNDDYVFLDKVAGRGFGALWGPPNVALTWWRPWSREFHYWWLQRAFGPVEWPFHLVNLVLACGVLAALWAFLRRLVGAPAASIAVAGAATMPGWAVLLLWSGGAQDLWMLLLSLLSLLAWRADRVGWAALAYALALLSKESAAPMLLFFFALDFWDRRPWSKSLLRAAPSFAVALAWTLAHSLLLGGLWTGTPVPLVRAPGAVAPWLAVLKSVLTAFSLDAWPLPDGGWKSVWWDGLRGALLLLCFVKLLARLDEQSTHVPSGAPTVELRGVLPFALTWWTCGALPLLLPGLGWHTHYAQFAGFGLWLAAGSVLARRTGMAMVLLSALAFISAGRAATPSSDWGDAAYQRRAGASIRVIRTRLLTLYPRLAPHSRLWFAGLPNTIAFLSVDGLPVRVWYRDHTLQAGPYSAYRPPVAGEIGGGDHFFRVDQAGTLYEVALGDTTKAVTTTVLGDIGALQRDPRWEHDRLMLAYAFARGRNWRSAAAEFRQLATVFRDSSGYAFDAATAFVQAGDSATGYEWLVEAARRPGAPPELIEATRHLTPSPPATRERRRLEKIGSAHKQAGARHR
jgi:hypothetical protein